MISFFELNSVKCNSIKKVVYKKCGENAKSIILQVSRAINDGIIIIISKCIVCGDRKIKFIKEQEAKGLLNNLVIRELLSKIPIQRDILF